MWQYISKFILRNRILLIFLIFGLTSLMAYKGKDAKLAYTMAKLLPSDHQVSTEYQDFLEMYGEQNLFVIAIKDPNILKFNNLADLNQITQKIEDLDGVETIVSLTNLPILVKDTSASKFILKRWYSGGFKTQQEIDSSFNNFSNHLIYKDFLNNPQNTITTLLISIEDSIIRTPNRAELIFKINDIVNSYGKNIMLQYIFQGFLT